MSSKGSTNYLYPPTTLVVADSALLAAISMGYAFSHALSLLLSVKNRRAFGFFTGLRKSGTHFPSQARIDAMAGDH